MTLYIGVDIHARQLVGRTWDAKILYHLQSFAALRVGRKHYEHQQDIYRQHAKYQFVASGSPPTTT